MHKAASLIVRRDSFQRSGKDELVVADDAVLVLDDEDLEADREHGIGVGRHHLPRESDDVPQALGIRTHAEAIAFVSDVLLVRTDDALLEGSVTPGFSLLNEMHAIGTPQARDG